MRKIYVYIIGIVALLSCASCSKRAEYDQVLGLISKVNVFSEGSGSTQVGVFSNTDWTVEMTPVVDWASIDRFSGHKSGYLVFDYAANYGRARFVYLIFKAGGQVDTMKMYQNSHIADADCVLTLSGSSLTPTSEGEIIDIPFTTNLIYDLNDMYLTLQYAPEDVIPETPWVRLLEVTVDNVKIEVLPNTTGAVRKTYMQISHTDAGDYDSKVGDTVSSNVITIVQTL